MKKRHSRSSNPTSADLASSSETQPQTQTPRPVRPAVPENAVLVWDARAALSDPVPPDLPGCRSFAIVADGGTAILNSSFRELLEEIVRAAGRLKVYAAVVPLHHPELAKMTPKQRVEAALRAGVPEAPALALAEEGEAVEQVFCHPVAMWEADQASHLEILISADPRWPEGRVLWACRNVLAPHFLRHRPWAVVGGGWQKAAEQVGFFFVPFPPPE